MIYSYKDFDEFEEKGYLYHFVKDRKLTKINHSHDFYEIVYVIKGSATQIIDGKKTTLSCGDFTFLNENNTHYFESQSDDAYLFCLSVMKNKFDSVLTALEFTPRYAVVYNSGNYALNEKMQSLSAYSSPFGNVIIFSLLTEFLYSAVKSTATPKENVKDNLLNALDQMKNVKNIVGGVERFAFLSGYSHTHLCRLTKLYFNSSPKQLLFEIQMDLSCNLLKTTCVSVDQIAFEVGFSSASQFYSIFKNKFLLTPNEYRKKYRSHNI